MTYFLLVPLSPWKAIKLCTVSELETFSLTCSMLLRLGPDVAYVLGQVVPVFVLEQKHFGKNCGMYTHCFSKQCLVSG